MPCGFVPRPPILEVHREGFDDLLGPTFVSVVLTLLSLVGDISHIGCHGGYFTRKLSSHSHPTVPVMMVWSVLSH